MVLTFKGKEHQVHVPCRNPFARSGGEIVGLSPRLDYTPETMRQLQQAYDQQFTGLKTFKVSFAVGRVHTVTVKNGNYRCTCPSWYECRHIKYVKRFGEGTD